MSPEGRVFFAAARRFCEAPLGADALAALVTTRMRFVEDAGVKWKDGAAVLVIIACAAQSAAGNPYRRRALAEAMSVMLDLWHGDLGDQAMTPPRAPASAPRQYKDD